MNTEKTFSNTNLSSHAQWAMSRIRRWVPKKFLGLKSKISLLIVLNLAGVLFLSSYLDFHFARKAQIDLFLNRNLYIAKQIDIAIPDQAIKDQITPISEEIDEWLLSRPGLMQIDVFLFSPQGWETAVSSSKWNVPSIPVNLSNDQINFLKRDRDISVVRETAGERWLEAIVPLYAGNKVIGGVRVVSSFDEAQDYLRKKRDRTLILTLSSFFVILTTVTLLFRKLVGNPIQKLVEAMSRAEKGDLEAKALVQSHDELGELGRHFNQMLKTIRETHEQNIHLLSQVHQFNEELSRKIEAATSELAKRNEELKLLNEALFETQRELGQAEKLAALGEITAMMAHQIGTPLNSISGYIQLMLQEGNISSTDYQRLKIIESQLDRLADSVKKMLSFTRQPKPQLRPLDVNGILVELIHLSEPWLNARKVELSSSLDSDLPLISGDPTRLQTVFLNLITNAIDAMPNGGRLAIKTCRISPHSSSSDGKWLEISISDTGIGITEETKKKIFDPFFTTKKVGEGSGLGLAICDKIVKEHSGRLDVQSEVGKGSTFVVFLPVPNGYGHNK